MAETILKALPTQPPVAADWSSGELVDGKTAQIECPMCAETISIRAKRCRHCGELLNADHREADVAERLLAREDAANRAAGIMTEEGTSILTRPFSPVTDIALGVLTLGLWALIRIVAIKRRKQAVTVDPATLAEGAEPVEVVHVTEETTGSAA
ncbi:hypothetical protein [Parasphingopyxis marina]|uniref:Uncharacterized protein n=1 Tax=Parasphingopyxis marina TaxID=2761622 RepID=A0A842HZY8_9SPHN|nr:hypothetical protein [Parasphingopyxis marina]MBC2778445.1 hypothetical protein [Parasphingopyxis marina]